MFSVSFTWVSVNSFKESSLVFLACLACFTSNRYWICVCVCVYWNDHMFFSLLCYCCELYLSFCNVKPTWHFWGTPEELMLGSICYILIGMLASFLMIETHFVRFWYQGYSALIKRIEAILYSFIFIFYPLEEFI